MPETQKGIRKAETSLIPLLRNRQTFPGHAGSILPRKGTERMYTITTGWIDTYKRTRTWNLLDPSGAKVAEITTKTAAQRLADTLNAGATTR